MALSVRPCKALSLMTLPPLRPFPLILNRGPISSMMRVLGVVTCVTMGTMHANETNDMLDMTTSGWHGRLLVLMLWTPMLSTLTTCLPFVTCGLSRLRFMLSVTIRVVLCCRSML